MNWLILSAALIAQVTPSVPSASFEDVPDQAPLEPEPQVEPETKFDPETNENASSASTVSGTEADATVSVEQSVPSVAPFPPHGITREVIVRRQTEALSLEREGHLSEAADQLRVLVERCAAAGEAICDEELHANLYRDLGIVLAGQEGQLFVAANAFEQALLLAPGLTIPPERDVGRVNQAFTEAKKAGSPDEHLMSENVEEEDDGASKPGRTIFLVNAVSEFGVFTVQSAGNVAVLKEGGHMVLAGGKKGSVVIGLDVGGGAYLLEGNWALGYLDVALAVGWVWGQKNPGFALLSSGLEYIPYGQVPMISSHGLFGGFIGPVNVAASFSSSVGGKNGEGVSSLVTGIQIGLGSVSRRKAKGGVP